jgi:hypothetical protein
VQKSLGRYWHIRLLRAQGTTAADEIFNCQQEVTGTIGSIAYSASAYGQISRRSSTSATATTSQNRWTFVSPCMWLGNAAGLGGFYLALGWGFGSGPSDAKLFRGFTVTTVPTIAGAGVETSTALVDCCGFAVDSTDTNFQVMHNDPTGGCTKVDLGSNFPARNAATDFYLGEFFSTPNQGSIDYILTNLTSGAAPATGNISTNLPTNSTFYRPYQIEGQKSSGTAIVTHQGWIYTEAPY